MTATAAVCSLHSAVAQAPERRPLAQLCNRAGVIEEPRSSCNVGRGSETLQAEQWHVHSCCGHWVRLYTFVGNRSRSSTSDNFRSCWMGSAGEGEHVTAMVKAALELGYRHVDTVQHSVAHLDISFWALIDNCRLRTTVGRSRVLSGQSSRVLIGNEVSVDKALQGTDIPRHEIFVTTKLE